MSHFFFQSSKSWFDTVIALDARQEASLIRLHTKKSSNDSRLKLYYHLIINVYISFLFIYNIHKGANAWSHELHFHCTITANLLLRCGLKSVGYSRAATAISFASVAGVLSRSRAVQSWCSRNWIQTASNLAVVMQSKCNSYENNLRFLSLGFWILISLHISFNLGENLSRISLHKFYLSCIF